MSETTAGALALAGVEPVPGVPKPDPILVAKGIERHFGGNIAVDVEHLEIQRGAITSLIGPNGAGKTTFFNLMTSFDTPNKGTRTFDGTPLERVAAHNVAKLGMVRTFQLTKALTRLSCLENMKLASEDQVGEGMFASLLRSRWRAQEATIEAQADELLARFKLDHMRDEFAGTLSGGQRKLLEMARALMVDPKMVMLDEPMAGVNPALTESLLDHVKALPSFGMTVLFVEHDMDVVMDISDWIVVMAQGRIIAEGPPASIAKNQAVIDAYLGEHHEDKSVFEEGPAAITVPGGAEASAAASERARVARAAMGDTDPALPRTAGGAPRSTTPPDATPKADAAPVRKKAVKKATAKKATGNKTAKKATKKAAGGNKGTKP